MISHALNILINELNQHFQEAYHIPVSNETAIAGNISEINYSSEKNPDNYINKLIFTVINILEDRSGNNFPGFSSGEASGKNIMKKPSSAMNVTLLISANHGDYNDALLMISRTIKHFRTAGILTKETVNPGSLTINANGNAKDRPGDFRLSVTLHSCSLEDISHIWSITGGKNYPFVLYDLRII